MRHKRQKTFTNFAASSRVMEDMRNDFKEKELVEGWERRRGGKKERGRGRDRGRRRGRGRETQTNVYIVEERMWSINCTGMVV